MTSPEKAVPLGIVAHDDVHISVAVQKEGWGDAYQKRAAVLHLSKADLQKLGVTDNARLEITSAAGSVVVVGKPDAAGEAGIGTMPASLYTNHLAGYDPASLTLPGRYIEARVAPTEKDITPISDLIVRRNHA